MPYQQIDIQLNHDLLNSNFQGYKLSLENVPTIQKNLTTSVLRTLLKSSQYSFLHVKHLSLHNHLFGESNIDGDHLYFIDNSWKVNKLIVNPSYEYNMESSIVFHIPKPSRTEEASFNVSLQLLSHVGLALLTDGFDKFYILDTNEISWHEMYSDELTKIGGQFSIKDSKCTVNSDNLRSLQCLFFSIKNDKDKHFNVLHLITFVENDKKAWIETSIKELSCKGTIYYNYLDRDTDDALIAVSDQPIEFISDSEHPIQNKSTPDTKTIYTWSQNDLQIILNIPFSLSTSEHTLATIEIKQEDVEVLFTDDSLSVKFNGESLLVGKLHARLIEEESSFKITDDTLIITLSKWEGGLMWPEIIIGNTSGKYLINNDNVEKLHKKLGHLCAEQEVPDVNHHIFNSEQTEDCDDADPIAAPILERLDIGAAHSATHRMNLNAHGILLTVPAANAASTVPSIGLKSDVDTLICKLGKKEDHAWDIWHDGTLYAFGYVQASKQQRKFTVCPPDLSYVAILESSRHIFLYRQGRAVSSGCELRHRASGRKVAAVAQQQVISMTNSTDELLGVYVTNNTMYVLTETELVIYSIV